MGKKIEIMDTTLRDGEQTQGVSYNAAEKLNLAKMLLSSVKINRLEVTSALISEAELSSLKNICSWAKEKGILEKIEVLTFVDYNRSIDWILNAGCKTINLLCKGSKKHCETQLKKTLKQHIEDIGKTLDYATKNNVNVNVYLEDWSNGFRDSKDYVMELTKYLVSTNQVKRIMLPDTLGVFTPEDIRNSIGEMINNFPSQHFDFHPHNDYGLASANVMESVKLGVKGVHATVNCMGERAGNADLAQVVAILKDKLDIDIDINEKSLGTASRMVEVFSGKRIAANSPIVGKDVFTQTAGIHADGDKKGNLYFNPLVPERFGRSRIYALGKMAGKASLDKNLEALGIELSSENKSTLLKKIVSLADEKKTIFIDDIPFLIADVLEGKATYNIHITEARLSSEKGGRPYASLRLTIKDKSYDAISFGDGAYDAFMRALRSILKEINFPIPTLTDYEVRIPPSGKTSALVETVITWKIDNNTFQTIGFDLDQNIAAIIATEKALNMIEQKNLGKLTLANL